MTSKHISPVYVLRLYAWALLQANDNDTWNTTEYGGLIPIVPLNEEPDLSEFDGPRIIYDFSLSESSPSYYRGRGTMTFAVRDHNFRRLTKTMNILQAAFERHDESARDVNDWSQVYLDGDPQNPTDGIDVSFGSIRVGFAESGTPEEEEGGFMVGVVSINFDYFVEWDVNTRPGL